MTPGSGYYTWKVLDARRGQLGLLWCLEVRAAVGRLKRLQYVKSDWCPLLPNKRESLEAESNCLLAPSVTVQLTSDLIICFLILALS